MIHEDLQITGSHSITGSLFFPNDTGSALQEEGSIATHDGNLYVYNGTEWSLVGEQVTPSVSADIDYLIVGGGGGGGARRGSGGGGGGFRATTGSATSGGGSALESKLNVTAGDSITVVVGSGGTGAAAGSSTYGSKGGDSSISGDSITTITSIGGGAGISLGSSQTGSQDGGCGGGGGARGASDLYEYPPYHFGDGTTGQGYDGGYGTKAHNGGGGGGGGGGGAGSAGSNGGGNVNNSYGQSANGGNGLSNNITGTSVTYSEGGDSPNGVGGSYRTNMDANSGDGSSGNAETDGVNNASGNGGSGVVIFAYDSGSINAIGGQEGDAGSGRKYHKFNNSGTFYIGNTTDFQIVTDNLYAHYDLANISSYSGTGTTITDLAGSNNLTITSAPPFVDDNGGGLDFDGSADYAEKTSISYTPHVIDIWFNNHDTIGTGQMQGNYQTLASFGSYPYGFNLGAWTGIFTNETVSMFTNGTSGGVYIRDTISAGVHNMVWRWTGTEWKCYIDSTEKTVYTGGSGGQALRAATAISMGRGQGGNSYEFDGHIYEMRIYTDGLTNAQITQNYNARKDRFGL